MCCFKFFLVEKVKLTIVVVDWWINSELIPLEGVGGATKPRTVRLS
jgi:hypothetical protein